jgi:ankyrin repeat protein
VPETDRLGRSQLHYAALEGRTDDIQALIDSGADINLPDKDGRTPLHFAAQQYQVRSAELLCKAGADIQARDKFGNTALWRATFDSRGREDLIRLLLASGANPDAANDSGVSPRQLAERIGNYDVKRFFTPATG